METRDAAGEVMRCKSLKVSQRVFWGICYWAYRFGDFLDWLFPLKVKDD